MFYVDGVVVRVRPLRDEDDISVAQGHIATTTMLRDCADESRTSKGRRRSLYNSVVYTSTMEKGRGPGRSGINVKEALIVARIPIVDILFLMRDNSIRKAVVIRGIMATKTKTDYL